MRAERPDGGFGAPSGACHVWRLQPAAEVAVQALEKNVPIRGLYFLYLEIHMGNKIVTEADRKATPRPATLPGFTLPTGGRGQRVSLERGVATRSKKNPGKRSKKGG